MCTRDSKKISDLLTRTDSLSIKELLNFPSFHSQLSLLQIFLAFFFSRLFSMDAIKKKMMSLASETASAEARAKKYEQEAHEASNLADKTEEQVQFERQCTFL